MKHISCVSGLNVLLDVAANVTRKSLIDRYAAFAIQNMAAETGCGARNRDDFISWLSRPYLDLCKKEAVLRHVHPVKGRKGTRRHPSGPQPIERERNISIPRCGSPRAQRLAFKYIGMKFNPRHPFPAPLCLISQ